MGVPPSPLAEKIRQIVFETSADKPVDLFGWLSMIRNSLTLRILLILGHNMFILNLISILIKHSFAIP